MKIENLNSQKEQTRLKNRQIMKRLIDITVCLNASDKPFRRHSEKYNDIHKELFLDIVGHLK